MRNEIVVSIYYCAIVRDDDVGVRWWGRLPSLGGGVCVGRTVSTGWAMIGSWLPPNWVNVNSQHRQVWRDEPKRIHTVPHDNSLGFNVSHSRSTNIDKSRAERHTRPLSHLQSSIVSPHFISFSLSLFISSCLFLLFFTLASMSRLPSTVFFLPRCFSPSCGRHRRHRH